MKSIFAILMLLMLCHSVLGQHIPISYVNEERLKDSSGIRLDWDERISRITLKSQNEFEFRSFPMPSSCLTWRQYSGTWKKQNDTLVFYDQYELVENDTRLKFVNKPNKHFYTLIFKTDINTILTNKDIVIELVYDFDSRLKSLKLNLELNNEQVLKIPFDSIPDRNKLASFRYEYVLSDGDKRYGYITESNMVNMKQYELPNFAEITIVKAPKKEIVYRTTKAIIIDDGLKIVSTEKTKSDLPDFTRNITFKKNYAVKNKK